MNITEQHLTHQCVINILPLLKAKPSSVPAVGKITMK